MWNIAAETNLAGSLDYVVTLLRGWILFWKSLLNVSGLLLFTEMSLLILSSVLGCHPCRIYGLFGVSTAYFWLGRNSKVSAHCAAPGTSVLLSAPQQSLSIRPYGVLLCVCAGPRQDPAVNTDFCPPLPFPDHSHTTASSPDFQGKRRADL